MSQQRPTTQTPIFLQLLWVTLTTTIVLTLNIIIGLTITQFYYSFWFSVSLFAFAPIWLCCYGLIFHSRFRYIPMALGVFISIFLLAFFYPGEIEPLRTRLQMPLALATTGTFAMSIGACFHSFVSLFQSQTPTQTPTQDHSSITT